jgi:hypothetical protein
MVAAPPFALVHRAGTGGVGAAVSGLLDDHRNSPMRMACLAWAFRQRLAVARDHAMHGRCRGHGKRMPAPEARAASPVPSSCRWRRPAVQAASAHAPIPRFIPPRKRRIHGSCRGTRECPHRR